MDGTENKEYPFEFSIIMSVYNVEEYIHEAVDSVINQTFDFSKVQIIFVDDGSMDSSGMICEEYREQYPDNVVAVHKENGGLASAKNVGLKYAEGKYINFFDPDDILSNNTLDLVYEFFEEHYEETDVVSIPLYFFEAQTGEHQLNTKYRKGSRIIDLSVEYNIVQASNAAAFYKKEVIKKVTFDEELLIAEDLKSNFQVILKKKTLGVVSGAKYWYRRRISDNQSLLIAGKAKKEYYTKYLENVAKYFVQHCLETYHTIPRYVQYTLFHDLCWKYKTQHIPEGLFTEDELVLYQHEIFSLLKYIDDDIIMNYPFCTKDLKWFLRWKKYELIDLPMGREGFLTRWISTNKCSLILDFFNPYKGGVSIEGRLTIPIAMENLKLFICINGEKTECVKHNIETQKEYSLDFPISFKHNFVADVPILDGIANYEISFYVELFEKEFFLSEVSLAKYFPITNMYKRSYFLFNGRKLTKEGGVLHISRTTAFEALKSELALYKEFYQKKNLGYKKAIISRALYHLLKPFKKKELWLVSDKADKADDNGEAFFTYLIQNKSKNIRPVFLLSKSSADYPRMKSLGHVVSYMSKLHKFLFLFADYTISAYSHNELNRPFQETSFYYGDITHKCKFIFLQHGVTYNNVVGGLNRFHKNIRGFAVSAVAEKEAICADCSYDEKTVWLTGLPRFDQLYDSSDKTVTIMPTWRRFLFSGFSAKDDRWELKSSFAESNYYKYYYGLVNDKRLTAAAKRLGYKILFVPHSVFFPYLNQFEKPEYAEILGYGISYRDIFARSSMIVTDYSSAVFDVAYLRKPVVYTQFDKERFYTEHGYKPGYFDFERNGFGEVEYDLESTVDRMIEYMENGCKLKDKYRERIDGFFAFNDTDNCRRVYEKIIELNNRKG